MNPYESNVPVETEVTSCLAGNNPAWPILAPIGLLWLILSPVLLFEPAPHKEILSLIVFVFAVFTICLASSRFNLICRILTLAWGGVLALICLAGMTTAIFSRRLEGLAPFVIGFVIALAVLYLANRPKKNGQVEIAPKQMKSVSDE